MRHSKRRFRIFWKTAGPALLALPVVVLVIFLGMERAVTADEFLQGIRGQTPEELHRLFTLLLILLSAILVFWIVRLWLGSRGVGRTGVVVGAALWLLGAMATLLLMLHIAQVVAAWVPGGDFPEGGSEALLFVLSAVFGLLQGTEHFLYKLKGSRDAWMEAGLRFRGSAMGGVIGAEVRRLHRTRNVAWQQRACECSAEPDAAADGGRDPGSS